MDVQRTNEAPAARPDPGAERAAALAERRRHLSAEGQRSAEAANARRTEQIAAARDAVADAVGANTRVAITRAPASPVFLYRAIDSNTGEVVQEWPRLEFLALNRAAQAAAAQTARGAAIDQQT